jgi:phytoene desaturase
MAKSIGIIGAGPGGLAAGVLLQKAGYNVEIFEAQETVGGRNGQLESQGFRFDLGPTFFLLPQVLEEIFSECGANVAERMPATRLEPMYQLNFGDGTELEVSSDPRKMSDNLRSISPRDADTFWSFRERQRKKFDALFPALKNSYQGWMDLARLDNFSALPFLDFSSVYSELSDYFTDERARLAFTFQAKYLGMSPFECPSLFTILPHIEHHFGVWHPKGGCGAVSQQLAALFTELGGRLHLGTPVRRVLADKGRVQSVELGDGDHRHFDSYVMNADFAYGMKELFAEESRKKYKNSKIDSYRYSCSTFMIYLGLKKKLKMPHHKIHFAQNYRKNIRELVETLELSEDPSIYIHNPSLLDDSMAPKGKSAVYVLVPVPNLNGKVDWTLEKKRYRDLVLSKIQQRTGFDFEKYIEFEEIVTPLDWEQKYRVHKGAVFSLAHNLDQMLHMRPQNRSEDFNNLYLVGGGTHPGSGLPTILESGRIAARMIQDAEKSWVSQGTQLAERWTGKWSEKLTSGVVAPAVEKLLPLSAQLGQQLTSFVDQRFRKRESVSANVGDA